MNAALQTRLWFGLPGVAMAIVAMAVATEAPDAARLLQAALNALGVVVVWSVAVVVHLRYPQRRLGLLLFALAGAHTIQSLAASSDPWLHTLARVSRPVVEILLAWVMLAFPGGRLQSRMERALMGVAVLAVLTLWLPGVMLSARIPMAGAHVICHGDCPRNVLMLAEQPELAQALFGAFRAVGAVSYGITIALLVQRLRRATPLGRRALRPVLLASVARALNMAVFLSTGALALGLVFTFWGVPLAIALGYLRERAYVTEALVRLVSGLRSRPGVHELRDLMAVALDDPHLKLAYRLTGPDRWVDADGRPIDLPGSDLAPQRATSFVEGADGRPLAALIHDPALLDEPALVQAVASSALVMLESHRIEAELRASSISAVAHERDRIERDLHDGAQQRLIALRMKLSVTARLIDADPQRATDLVRELDHDVAAALAELRALARGVFPPVLVDRGLAVALSDAARRLAAQTEIQVDDVGRFDPAVESAVYFCCLEALQNAAKHAGSDATVVVGLALTGGTLAFRVEDDGVGFSQTQAREGGRGLANMHARMAAVSGQLTIGSAPGGGVCVRGQVPLAGVARSTGFAPPHLVVVGAAAAPPPRADTTSG